MVTVTKDGECHLTITLELNINLGTNGEVGASLQALSDKKPEAVEKDEDPLFTIPDFVGGLKVNFGKPL